MIKYSGRTTAHVHKTNKWQEVDSSNIPSAFSAKLVFDAQWTDCPVEVEEEVKRLWQDHELGNDYYYFSWDEAELSEEYPIISDYFKKCSITGDVLIHWWW